MPPGGRKAPPRLEAISKDFCRFIDRSKISIALPVGAGSFDAG
jgi:hypothetical protein